MKKLIFIIIILLILSISVIFIINFLQKENLTGQAILSKHTWTRAICNDSNYCEDYVIECQEGEIKSISPTGNAIWHEKNWTDPRNDSYLKENFCK